MGEGAVDYLTQFPQNSPRFLTHFTTLFTTRFDGKAVDDPSPMKPTALAWDNVATRESKSKIMLWLLAGWIYNLVEGVLFSLSSLLLFVPRIFIASLAAIPVALINAFKIRRL